jgi:hypothetical protein
VAIDLNLANLKPAIKDNGTYLGISISMKTEGENPPVASLRRQKRRHVELLQLYKSNIKLPITLRTPAKGTAQS